MAPSIGIFFVCSNFYPANCLLVRQIRVPLSLGATFEANSKALKMRGSTWHRCTGGGGALPAGGGQTQEELKKKLRHTSQLEEVEARALVEEAKVAIYVAKPLGFDSFSCNTVPR